MSTSSNVNTAICPSTGTTAVNGAKIMGVNWPAFTPKVTLML